jgi:hypothetical protein
MRFVGRDDVVVYSPADDFRKEPAGEPKFNDSTWLQWFDLERGCGGVHRIGHEHNLDGGSTVASWSNLITPAGIYRRSTYLPLRTEDALPRGWGGGDDVNRNEIIDGEHIWTVEDPEAGVSARLVFTDWHGRFCGWPSAGRSAEDLSAHHIDIAGPVTGSITLLGQTFEVSGMGLRDHGWGHRNLRAMLSHRYVTGCFGPELSFCAYAIHHEVNDRIETFGWCVQDEEVIFASDVDIVAYAETDSISTRGGHIRLTLADRQVVECELTAVAPGLASVFPNRFTSVNTLCRAEAGGRVGAGHFEASMNFHYGERVPERMRRALVGNGVYAGTVADMQADPDGPFVPKRTI